MYLATAVSLFESIWKEDSLAETPLMGYFPNSPSQGGEGEESCLFFLTILQMQKFLSCVPLRRLNPQAFFITAASAQALTGPGNISSRTTSVPRLPSASFQIKTEKAHPSCTMDGHACFKNSHSIVMSTTTQSRSFDELTQKKKFSCGTIPLSIE